MKRFIGLFCGSKCSSISPILLLFILNACSQEDCSKVTNINCVSPFWGGRVRLVGFNLKPRDTIRYIFYGKNDFQNPIDSFSVVIKADSKFDPNNTYVKLGERFDKNFDWKIKVSFIHEFMISDIRTYPQECVRCGINNISYFDQYVVKVNGEEQVGYITLSK
jgi:hypothetical protein